MKKASEEGSGQVSRREFIKASATAGLSLAALSAKVPVAFGAGSDVVRLGLIGCGGRGLYDSTKCLSAAPGVELVAMGDLFRDRLDETLKALRNGLGDKVKVTEETCFVGFDAYEKVLQCDVDLVILTEPPHFRPQHLKAAIAAGKHAFIEKPVAVDPVGVRTVIEAAEQADQKGLTIVAGTQARRMPARVEMMKRIHDGAIGDLVGGQCIRTGDAMRDWGLKERTPEMSDMEWQIRRWLFYTWLSGDFIAEMHVHELDIVNWAMGSPPARCYAIGGRQARTEPEFGDSYDHFAAEYEYPNGVRVAYLGSQIDGCSTKSFERFVGTKGTAYTDWAISRIDGPQPYEYEGPEVDPCLRQHADQIEAIREGLPLNEGRRIAESSMTAIMGRISAYTGRELSWKWVMNASELDLNPPEYKLGDLPVPAVAIPGKTPLI